MRLLLSKRSVGESAFILIFSLIFSWLAAERFLGIDRDYVQYLSFFGSLSWSYDGRFELGFVFLSLLVKGLGLSFYFLLFISSFISLSPKLFLIYKNRSWAFWGILYLLILYPLHEMTQIRVSIALGFGYLALYFSTREELSFRVITLSVLAVLFHWTLLCFVPFIVAVSFFKKRNITLIFSIILAPALVVYFLLGFLDRLNPQVIQIINSASLTQANPFSSRNVVFLTIVFIGLANINRIERDFLPWLYLSVFGVSFWYGMMEIPVFAHRVFELTIFSYFLWVPRLPKYSRAISMTFLSVLSIYLFISSLFIDPLFRSNL